MERLGRILFTSFCVMITFVGLYVVLFAVINFIVFDYERTWEMIKIDWMFVKVVAVSVVISCTFADFLYEKFT